MKMYPLLIMVIFHLVMLVCRVGIFAYIYALKKITRQVGKYYGTYGHINKKLPPRPVFEGCNNLYQRFLAPRYRTPLRQSLVRQL